MLNYLKNLVIGYIAENNKLRKKISGFYPKSLKQKVYFNFLIKKKNIKKPIFNFFHLKRSNQGRRNKFKAPKIAFYFVGKKTHLYQLDMWIEVLRELKIDFYVCLRRNYLLKVLEDRGVKAISIPKLQNLDIVEKNGTKTIFYVNNASFNSHMVRYSNLSHVQLLHGDSDKPPSYSPISQIYDLIFVSGQAGIDRYFKNKVFIPIEKFVIAGRPQLKKLDNVNITSFRKRNKPSIILFVTTWRGEQKESNFSTISESYQNIKKALNEGFSIIYRPHPLSCKNDEEQILIDRIKNLILNFNYKTNQFGKFSDPLFNTIDNIDDYNFNDYHFILKVSDVLVADLASTVNDWIYLGKPYFISKQKNLDLKVYKNSSLFHIGPNYFWSNKMNIKTCISKQKKLIQLGKYDLKKKYLFGISKSEQPDKLFSKSINYVLNKFDKKKHINSMILRSSR